MSQITIRTSQPPSTAGYLHPAGLLGTLRAHSDLIRQFAGREVVERHRGAYLGVIWNVVHPLITLAIYTFIFGYVFKSRWHDPAGADGPAGTAFVLPYFIGHALFHYFSECANRGPSFVSTRPNFVRKVVFPVEILPVVGVVSASVYPLVCLPCFLVAQFALTGHLQATALLLPIVVIPLVLLNLAVSWLLAAFGVFVRDMRHIVVVATQLLMYMTPVFYSVERIPASWRGLYELNPLTIVIENARRVLLWGVQPHWAELGVLTLVVLAFTQVCYAVFMRMRRGFADEV